MIPSTTPPLPPKQGQTLAGTLVWEYFLSVCNSTVSGLKLVLVHDTVHRHYTAYMKHYEIKKKNFNIYLPSISRPRQQPIQSYPQTSPWLLYISFKCSYSANFQIYKTNALFVFAGPTAKQSKPPETGRWNTRWMTRNWASRLVPVCQTLEVGEHMEGLTTALFPYCTNNTHSNETLLKKDLSSNQQFLAHWNSCANNSQLKSSKAPSCFDSLWI